jgi:hypothetical protein
MGDQKKQRLNLVTQAADASRRFLEAYHDMVALRDRAPFLGTLTDADLQGTALAYLDAATVTEFFTPVMSALIATYTDAANSGRNRRVLNQMTESV